MYTYVQYTYEKSYSIYIFNYIFHKYSYGILQFFLYENKNSEIS